MQKLGVTHFIYIGNTLPGKKNVEPRNAAILRKRLQHFLFSIRKLCLPVCKLQHNFGRQCPPCFEYFAERMLDQSHRNIILGEKRLRAFKGAMNADAWQPFYAADIAPHRLYELTAVYFFNCKHWRLVKCDAATQVF